MEACKWQVAKDTERGTGGECSLRSANCTVKMRMIENDTHARDSPPGVKLHAAVGAYLERRAWVRNRGESREIKRRRDNVSKGSLDRRAQRRA